MKTPIFLISKIIKNDLCFLNCGYTEVDLEFQRLCLGHVCVKQVSGSFQMKMDLCRLCFRKSQSSNMDRQLMSQMLWKTPCYSQGNYKNINHNLVFHLLHCVMTNFYRPKESKHLQRTLLKYSTLTNWFFFF